MKQLNDRLTLLMENIKSDNSTLGALLANETILMTTIGSFREQLDNCKRNKKEV